MCLRREGRLMQWTNPEWLSRYLQSLDGARFVALGNRLLAEVAASHGLARSCLALNLRITEPDGGLDARCVDAAITVGRIVPRTSTGYQFKGGAQTKSAARIVSEDI